MQMLSQGSFKKVGRGTQGSLYQITLVQTLRALVISSISLIKLIPLENKQRTVSPIQVLFTA